MASGDGLLVRVKPKGAVLTAGAARVLAEAASRWGNGLIEATSRASLQVRGLTPDGVQKFADAATDAGLGEGRNVIATPLAGDDPGVHPHTGQVAAALERSFPAGLPPKFGFVVDGGGVLPVGGAAGDVRVSLDGRVPELRLDGGVLAATNADPARSALDLARAFLTLATPEMRRMRDLAREGEQAVFAAAGLDPRPLAASDCRATFIGWHGYADGRGAFGVGAPFGTMTASDLLALADLSEQLGAGLRLTPWRTFLIAGLHASQRAAVDVLSSQFITDPADPRLSVTACPGQPACASATVDTRGLAQALAAAGVDGPVHVSGCSKGCARPAPARVTLVGNDGRYDLVRHGSAGDPPVARGLTAAEAAALA